jgi:hypothetical protein
VRWRLLVCYAVGQGLLIAASLLVPLEGWLHTGWDFTVGSLGAVFVLVGIRHYRPGQARVWYLIAAGVFLNTCGILVDLVLARFFSITSAPNVADLFWLSLYPGLIAGLGSFVYRQSLGDELDPVVLRTGACAVVSVILGIFAWELIIWPHNDQRISLAWRMVVAAYPLADLVLIALVLFLLLGGAARNGAFVFIVVSLLCFLTADIGWAVELRSGTNPGAIEQHLLEICSMSGQALIGAAALHPGMSTIAPEGAARGRRLGPARWSALAVLVLTAPAVLLAHALLDRLWLSGG